MRRFRRSLAEGRWFIMGVLVTLAVISVSSALAGTGVGAVFNLGQKNRVDKQSKLVGNVPLGALLRINNGGGGPAIDLRAVQGIAPMLVNSPTRVDNLNADFLDGLDSMHFLRSDGKATDSDKLDSLDSTAFVRTATYKSETVLTIGTLFGDGTRLLNVSCLAGDVLLSAGLANVDKGTILLESFPLTTTTWRLRWQNDGTADMVSGVALCANQ